MALEGQALGAGARVLIVDDNAMSRTVLEHRVKRLGHSVVIANSGLEAIIALDREPVDLVLLDIVMAEMDGREVLARVKADERFADLPIVMVSGLETQDVVTECLEAGACEYLYKPVNVDDLKMTLTDWLPGGSRREATQTERSTRPAFVADPYSDPETEPVFDENRLGELLADYGLDTTDTFISKFRDRADELIANINRAAADEDGEVWRRAAHDLKGGARLLGLARVAAYCRQVEIACGDRKFEDARAASSDLDTHVAEGLRALADHRREL